MFSCHCFTGFPFSSNVEPSNWNTVLAIHQIQKRYDVLAQDDFVSRMTTLRLLSGESSVRQLAMKPCATSKVENIREPAVTAAMVFERYRGAFDRNVALYEDMVRIFTVPHALTDAESKTIAQSRITASQLSAMFAQLSEILKDAASLAFVSAVVQAPGDPEHTALNMTSGERERFRADLRRGFGDLAKQKTVSGVEQAALALIVYFDDQSWRLAK
jgi:hypothetical protein